MRVIDDFVQCERMLLSTQHGKHMQLEVRSTAADGRGQHNMYVSRSERSKRTLDDPRANSAPHCKQ